MLHRSMVLTAVASLAMLAAGAPAFAQTAKRVARSGQALIDKRAVLARATWLDNRDVDWYLANAPFIDTPDKQSWQIWELAADEDW